MYVKDKERFDVNILPHQGREAVKALEVLDHRLQNLERGVENDATRGLDAAVAEMRDVVAEAMDECCHRKLEKRQGRRSKEYWCAPNFKVVALDETEYWELDEELMDKIDAIFGIYVYDANCRTHCCSFTPSYWLRQAGVDWIPSDNNVEASCKNRIEEIIFANSSIGRGLYYACHDIEALDPIQISHFGNPGCPWSDLEGETEEEKLASAEDMVVDAVSDTYSLPVGMTEWTNRRKSEAQVGG